MCLGIDRTTLRPGQCAAAWRSQIALRLSSRRVMAVCVVPVISKMRVEPWAVAEDDLFVNGFARSCTIATEGLSLTEQAREAKLENRAFARPTQPGGTDGS